MRGRDEEGAYYAQISNMQNDRFYSRILNLGL